MISINELVDILNRELSDEFIQLLHERWEEGNLPIDQEHPEVEAVIGNIVDDINKMDSLPLDTEYE